MRDRPQLLRNIAQQGIPLFPSHAIRQSREPHRDAAPSGDRSHQALERRLQHRRMVAKRRGFSDRFVDHGIERDDLSREFAPNRLLRVGRCRASLRQCRAEPIDDLG